MTTFSVSDIANLANLSGLSLSDEEAESLSDDLGRIIEHVNKLDELDVTGVEPTYQVAGLTNVSRDDSMVEENISSATLLSLAPESKNNQIKVPKVL